MKKRWKWTLFKKIFLMLMVSFVLINVINVYLDFQNAKENSYKTLEDSYFSLKVREMEGYFHYENDNLDQPFYDKVSEAFTSKLYSTNNVLIIDNNGGGTLYDKAKTEGSYIDSCSSFSDMTNSFINYKEIKLKMIDRLRIENNNAQMNPGVMSESFSDDKTVYMTYCVSLVKKIISLMNMVIIKMMKLLDILFYMMLQS